MASEAEYPGLRQVSAPATPAYQGFAATLPVGQTPGVTDQTKLFDGTYIKTAMKRAKRDALQTVEDWGPKQLLALHRPAAVGMVRP